MIKEINMNKNSLLNEKGYLNLYVSDILVELGIPYVIIDNKIGTSLDNTLKGKLLKCLRENKIEFKENEWTIDAPLDNIIEQ